MRYPIRISKPWRPLFALFGFSTGRSYAELDGQTLSVRFGSTREQIPRSEIAGVKPGRWPWYYGLGTKLGPKGGVSYVGSTKGIVQIDFVRPRPIAIWGPFRASQARCLIMSLENPDQFINDLRAD